MYINSIELVGFEPMRHGGVSSFKADWPTTVNVLLGLNGCGKSSLLRELSPYPAKRPDYETNGKKILCLSHEGSQYKLTSDFTNRQKPHSFIRDDTELNLSGTTEVQQDLVEQ